MSHKHWPEDHPYFEAAKVCPFRTIKACDENATQFDHGHLGLPCAKEFQPSKARKGETNKIATCTLIYHPEVGQSFAEKLADQIARAG